MRSEGVGEDFVYVIQYRAAEILKQQHHESGQDSVTVLERGDTTVSVREDMDYKQIAPGGSPLSDGCTVME